MFSTKFIIRPS